ncbi:MAG: hypothetical protein F4Y57_05990, partial [Acidobacteria bacterium]|nr:hypothetical protein [Acidobacteriota bacterium]
MTALRAGVTDQFVAIAAETAYGTPATSGWRVIPAINDDWTPNIQEVGTGAFRPGRQAMVADQTQQVKVGGTGSIETRIP